MDLVKYCIKKEIKDLPDFCILFSHILIHSTGCWMLTQHWGSVFVFVFVMMISKIIEKIYLADGVEFSGDRKKWPKWRSCEILTEWLYFFWLHFLWLQSGQSRTGFHNAGPMLAWYLRPVTALPCKARTQYPHEFTNQKLLSFGFSERTAVTAARPPQKPCQRDVAF